MNFNLNCGATTVVPNMNRYVSRCNEKYAPRRHLRFIFCWYLSQLLGAELRNKHLLNNLRRADPAALFTKYFSSIAMREAGTKIFQQRFGRSVSPLERNCSSSPDVAKHNASAPPAAANLPIVRTATMELNRQIVQSALASLKH